jgi:hypothetical protein
MDECMKTAIDRASEAIEAAEKMFLDEMGAVIDLSPGAKMALIVKITGAIRAAVADERKRAMSAQGASRSGAEPRRVAASIAAPVARPLRFSSG